MQDNPAMQKLKGQLKKAEGKIQEMAGNPLEGKIKQMEGEAQQKIAELRANYDNQKTRNYEEDRREMEEEEYVRPV